MKNKGSSTKEIQAYVDNYKEMYGTTYELPPPPKGQKGYTFEELFGDTDLSNGFIKKTDGVSILSNYKVALENRFSILQIIGFMLLSIIGSLLFFELLRRIFYYVVLGSIKPLK
jgi:hypothetical protein